MNRHKKNASKCVDSETLTICVANSGFEPEFPP